MLGLACWILGAAVAAGLGLAALWLQGRRPGGALRLVSAGHGLAGLVGTALVVAMLAGGAADPQNFGHLAAWFLAIGLAGGAVVVAAQLLRRRPSGLVVALHATLGVAGFVLLLAYRATGR